MGWLGYFAGKHEHLKELHLKSFTNRSKASVRNVMKPFFRCVCRNKSIRKIHFSVIDLLGVEMFTVLGPFFKNNHNLTKINVNSTFGEMKEGICLH